MTGLAPLGAAQTWAKHVSASGSMWQEKEMEMKMKKKKKQKKKKEKKKA
jgi:predicted alpha/beta superfamily hydrolase